MTGVYSSLSLKVIVIPRKRESRRWLCADDWIRARASLGRNDGRWSGTQAGVDLAAKDQLTRLTAQACFLYLLPSGIIRRT